MSATGSFFDPNAPEIVLKSLFLKYDTDGSGHLHSDELTTLFSDDLGLDATAAKSYALLLDKDGSSGVTFSEFSAWLKSGERFKLVNDQTRYHKLKAAVEMFEKYDTDGSQNITKDEFLKLHSDLGGTPETADTALAAMDKDGNGTVSFQEFLRWLNWVPLEEF